MPKLATPPVKQALRYVRVWDGPTRLAHWALVILVPVLWWTGSRGAWSLHLVTGDALLAVMAFRVFWGLAGGSTARFVHWLRSPGEVFRYARTLLSQEDMWREAGHNPMGGWSAILLLVALALQTLSGLFAETLDGLEEGPLSRLANDRIVQAATDLHEISFAFLVLLIALHLLAVAFYTVFKRQNLLTAMVHGHRLLPAPSMPLRPARLGAAVLATALALASVAAVAYLSSL